MWRALRLCAFPRCFSSFSAGLLGWAGGRLTTWAKRRLVPGVGGSKMTEITTALGTATTLFGVVTTLAVLVTGFFVGRSWLRRVK